MGFPIFPTFRYSQWAATRSMQWSNIVHRAVSGGQLTVPLWPNNPLWAWEWTYEVVIGDPKKLSFTGAPNNNSLYTDLQILQAFYFMQRGAANQFIYQPPDSVQVLAPLAPPDANNNVELRHVVGAVPDPVNGLTLITESVQELNNVNVSSVTVGGSPSSAWSLKQANTVAPYEGMVINFNSTPNSNVIAASYTYYYRCTFDEDSQDYGQFSTLLYDLKTLKFRQVRVVTT